VELDAAKSDLRPWSWGSVNAVSDIPAFSVRDGDVVELRFRSPDPPLVTGDVSIGLEDAEKHRVGLARMPPSVEGSVRVVSWRVSLRDRISGNATSVPVNLRFINFGMECERGSVTFISLSAKPPETERAAPTLSLDVETGNPIHVVRTNLAESATLVFSNVCDSAHQWTGAMTLADGNGHHIDKKIAFSLDHYGTHRIALPSPLPGMGVWKVKALLSCDCQAPVEYTTRFAQIDHHRQTSKLPRGKFRFGVVYHVTNYGPEDRAATLYALTAMGAKMARVGGLWQYHCEHEKGRFDWRVADGVVEALEGQGVAICGGCYANAPWATRADGSHAPRFGSAEPGTQREFMEKLSRRFGTRIDYYEIGNEWDIKGAGDMTPDEAVRTTRECAEAIKRGCPDACVIPCGWAVESSSHPMVRQKGFQERVMKECQDVLDAHPIHVHGPWPMHATRMREFFAMRAKEGINLPWFANETAVTSAFGREQAAAEALWHKIVWSWAHGSTDYCWYNLRATPGDDTGAEQGYGLLSRDYHPRKGFAAFSALAALLNGFDFLECSEHKSGRSSYVFKGLRNGEVELVFVAWDRLGGNGFQLAIEVPPATSRPSSAVAVDMYGNRTKIDTEQDEIIWNVEPRPCALVVCGNDACRAREECLAAEGPVRRQVRTGIGKPSLRTPELLLNDYSQATEIFQANPELLHRLWKGTDDVSASVWFTHVENRIDVLVKVTDDADAQLDSAFVQVGNMNPIKMNRISRVGYATVYTASFSAALLPNTVAIVVEDDDGEGVDVRISETVRLSI